MSSSSSTSSSFFENALNETNSIGIVVTTVVFVVTLAYKIIQNRRPPTALCKDFEAWPLIDKQELSHNTRRFTFALPSPTMVLGLPVGQHLTLMFRSNEPNDDGTTTTKQIQRSYTPVSSTSQRGSVSFCIKVYNPNPPKFPNGGKMSQHLDSLQIGDTINVKGPKGHLHYLGCGKFTISHVRHPTEHRVVKHLGMIAGGTGITPMLQVLHAIFENPKDLTKCKLLYANQTEDDILVRSELEDLATKYPDRFQVYYTLDHPPEKWTQGVGFISETMIAEQLYARPQLGMQIQIFMCGPPIMVKKACLPNLQALGYTDRDWYVF